MSVEIFDIRKYKGLIRKLAWDWRNILELDKSLTLEDLESEAAISFVKAAQRYKTAVGASFSTYLHRSIENDFRQLYAHARREKRAFPGRVSELEEANLLYSIASDMEIKYKSKLEPEWYTPEKWISLSEDCKTVVRLIMTYPTELETFLKEKNLTKDRLVDFLRKRMKWNQKRLDRFLAEIQ